MTDIFTGIGALEGGALDAAALEGRVVLVVNVASRCGLTPQYEGLERLQERFEDRGFTVLGVPCNQFAGQEPGSAAEIREFCSATYGVSFPLTEKLAVNGVRRHPLFEWLCETPDADGRAGEVEWNFEKFLVSPGGDVLARFRPRVEPEAEQVVTSIEAALDSASEPRVIEAREVGIGDRIRSGGVELVVTRIDAGLMGNDDFFAFVEDTSARWLKMPIPRGAQVEVLESRKR